MGKHLECSLNARSNDSNSMSTHLCDKHYRSLQKKLNPENYQLKCVVCSTGIRGSNYSQFRTWCEPELFQKTLFEHTDFQGTIIATDKVRRHSPTISKINKENSAPNDDEFLLLLAAIQKSLPALPYNITRESELIEIATKYSYTCSTDAAR